MSRKMSTLSYSMYLSTTLPHLEHKVSLMKLLLSLEYVLSTSQLVHSMHIMGVGEVLGFKLPLIFC